MKTKLLSIVILFCFFYTKQVLAQLTAGDILDKSIEFAGGVENIKKIHTTEYVYTYSESDTAVASVVIKRKQANGYVKSILSHTHYPQTTYYDGKTFSFVEGTKLLHNQNLEGIDEIKLQAFDIIQYAYKELTYTLERLADQKFNNFDCYVVKATSPNGYTLLNYFDKTNFRLIMIIYPKGNKSLLINYEFRDNVLFHTLIVNVDENRNRSSLELADLKLNNPISNSWFTAPFEKTIRVPQNIKEGAFNPVFGTPVTLTRSSKEQTEVYNEGKSALTLSVTWFNEYTFRLIHAESKNAPGNLKPGDGILVKIVSWDDTGYVCHYVADAYAGTQEYIRLK